MIIRSIFILLLALIVGTHPCRSSLAQYTPGGLYSLARAGDLDGLKASLAAHEPTQFQLNSALEAAVIGKQLQALRLLHERGADLNYVNPQGTALLVNAIMLSSDEAATLLLELGADPEVMGYRRLYHGYTMDWQWTPLMAASYQGNLELVKLLLAKNAQINKPGYSVSADETETAADIAAYAGQLDILKLLLQNGGRLADDTIFKAARGGQLEVIRYLHKRGFDINTHSGPQQKTLLMEAAWWGRLDIVEYLIKEGADVNAVDVNGYTALSDAAANGGEEFPHQLEIVKTLARNGADIRQAAQLKLTPLMRAQNPDVIEFLVEAGGR